MHRDRTRVITGVWLVASFALLVAMPASATSTDRVSQAVLALDDAGREAGQAFAPLRRGAPADRGRWTPLADLYEALDEVSEAAGVVRQQAKAFAGQDPSPLEVGRREFGLRIDRVDSLIAVAGAITDRAWDADLPEDDEESRLLVTQRARRAKQAADRLVAAGDELAYAVGVTEGVGPRSLSLSVVGILVVFMVLALISLVVGGIRKLDDDWQHQEQVKAAEALEKEPSIDATTLVLISAACATVITGRFRVRRIRRLLSPRQRRTPWSAQGRLILQGSHTVSRKN